MDIHLFLYIGAAIKIMLMELHKYRFGCLMNQLDSEFLQSPELVGDRVLSKEAIMGSQENNWWM